MTDNNQSKPFYRRLEFQGTLSNAATDVRNLHFAIDYAENKPDTITGIIQGTRTDASRLRMLLRHPTPYFVIRSKEYIGCKENIRSSKSSIKKISERHWPTEYGDRMFGTICDLELQEIEIETSLDNKDCTDRKICFYLAGPRSLWPLSWITTQSYTGDVHIDINPLLLEIPNRIQADIGIQPCFLYSSTLLEDGKQVSATDTVLTIVISTDASTEELSDSKFIESSIQIGDDLTLLASFASRKNIQWFQYDFYSATRLLHFVRHTAKSSTETVYDSDLLVTADKATGFIRSSFGNLQALRERDFDLFLPITNVLTGHESRYLEQKFILYFMALEKLKDMHAIKNDADSNFSNRSEKNKVLRSVRKTIRECLPHPGQNQRVLNKENYSERLTAPVDSCTM